MACEPIVSEAFERDLDETVEYLLSDKASPRTADNFLTEVAEAASFIAEFPDIHGISRKPLLREGGYREHFLRSHVIVYRADDDGVFLARLFHQRQDYEHLLHTPS